MPPSPSSNRTLAFRRSVERTMTSLQPETTFTGVVPSIFHKISYKLEAYFCLQNERNGQMDLNNNINNPCSLDISGHGNTNSPRIHHMPASITRAHAYVHTHAHTLRERENLPPILKLAEQDYKPPLTPSIIALPYPTLHTHTYTGFLCGALLSSSIQADRW